MSTEDKKTRSCIVMFEVDGLMMCFPGQDPDTFFSPQNEEIINDVNSNADDKPSQLSYGQGAVVINFVCHKYCCVCAVCLIAVKDREFLSY